MLVIFQEMVVYKLLNATCGVTVLWKLHTHQESFDHVYSLTKLETGTQQLKVSHPFGQLWRSPSTQYYSTPVLCDRGYSRFYTCI